MKGDEFEWLLGVPFGPKPTEDKAMKRVQEKFNGKLRIWQGWPLTIFGRAMVGNMSMLSHIWRASQFIPDIPVIQPGKKKPKSIWHPFYSAYWKYVQPGNFKGKFSYDTAAKRKREGGIGAIQPLVEIQALKAHWMVRMLANKNNDESWAQLMWLDFNQVAKQYKVKNPKDNQAWKSVNIQVYTLMEDIIKCWIQCNVMIVEEANNELKWIAEDGTHKSLAQLTVKALYNRLKTPKVAKNKAWEEITVEEWKTRWLFIAGVKHLAPRDRQLRFRIQQSKLWCGPNRGSTHQPIPICPICNRQETETDHPLTTECCLTNVVFKSLSQLWLEWTGNIWNEEEWNRDWIDVSTPHRNQLDMMMITAKRFIYHNYLQVVHNEVVPMDAIGMLAKTLGTMRYKIKAITWMCNSTEDQNIDGWDLQGNWALFDIESNKWIAIEDSLALKKS